MFWVSTGGLLAFGNAPANLRYGPQGDSSKVDPLLLTGVRAFGLGFLLACMETELGKKSDRKAAAVFCDSSAVV
jgi:hypothetical protein